MNDPGRMPRRLATSYREDDRRRADERRRRRALATSTSNPAPAERGPRILAVMRLIFGTA
jgi:hypothetical protein